MTRARPHPLTVSRFARIADRAIASLWRRGVAPKPPLDPEYLWRIGSDGFAPEDEVAGRSEEDVADFRLRLDRLCTSLREEADLNALGHTLAYGQLTSAIRKRHALGRLWKDTPDLATTAIAPPIIVIGQMRSGTTRVHRLLAADPDHAATRFCDSFDPVPKTPDWRPVKAGFALALARRINPWLDTLHPFGTTRADEEIGWLTAALNPCALEAQWRIPSYIAFSEARNAIPVYREFARILRTDAAHRGNAERPRILKCPQFTEDIPALVERFPDARLVVSRREDADTLRSSVSLVANQMAIQSDTVSLPHIEQEWERKIAMRNARIEQAFGATENPVAEIDFDRLNADWAREMRRLYRALGLDLRASAVAAMEAEQSRAASSPHRQHAKQIRGFSAS